MPRPAPIYADFLGAWVLIPESCDYQQGDAPSSGSYRIEEHQGSLTFTMKWTDADGSDHEAVLEGVPNGEKVPFSGGDLADALSIEAVSTRELNSHAYYRGTERMITQRQLDETGNAMRITQVVFFSDGSQLANISIYQKRVLN